MFMGYVVTEMQYLSCIRDAHKFKIIWVKRNLLLGMPEIEEFYLQLNPKDWPLRPTVLW